MLKIPALIDMAYGRYREVKLDFAEKEINANRFFSHWLEI
jgi:hypothetical protein